MSDKWDALRSALHGLEGERAEIMHYRGGAARFGTIEKVETPDSIWVLVDGESAPIIVGLHGIEPAPPKATQEASEPVAEPKGVAEQQQDVAQRRRHWWSVRRGSK